MGRRLEELVALIAAYMFASERSHSRPALPTRRPPSAWRVAARLESAGVRL